MRTGRRTWRMPCTSAAEVTLHSVSRRLPGRTSQRPSHCGSSSASQRRSSNCVPSWPSPGPAGRSVRGSNNAIPNSAKSCPATTGRRSPTKVGSTSPPPAGHPEVIMASHEGGQSRPAKQREDDVEVAEDSSTDVAERHEKLTDDVDALLDDIDEVLETNPEDFVRSFVQKGGQ